MTSFLFGGPRRPILSVVETLEAIEFDASVQETHSNSAEITQHPVEEGADITDHIRRQPEELSVNVIVSNNPPIILASLRAQPISGFGDPATRAEDAHQFLRTIMNNNQLVQFSTTLRDYTNMAIVSMSVDRDATTGNIANINMTLREIIIATTETVEPPVPANAGRQAKQNQGKKTTAAASAPVEAKGGSTLNNIFSAFGG